MIVLILYNRKTELLQFGLEGHHYILLKHIRYFHDMTCYK